jgi:hypothetical protein
MKPESKRGYYAEISTAATQSPEQIRVLFGAGFHKFPVGQYYISREQIIDAQSTFAGQVPDPSTES